jgi:RimJ/RimL family protein N-acetyltransferase
VAYTDWYEGGSIRGHITTLGGRLTRDFIRALFAYPFVQLKVRRFTALIPAKNLKANRFVEHLGFTKETVMHNVFENDDLNVWRMYREDCGWLPQ